MIRRIMNYLPANNRTAPPFRPTPDNADRIEPSLDTLVPDRSDQALRHQGIDL